MSHGYILYLWYDIILQPFIECFVTLGFDCLVALKVLIPIMWRHMIFLCYCMNKQYCCGAKAKLWKWTFSTLTNSSREQCTMGWGFKLFVFTKYRCECLLWKGSPALRDAIKLGNWLAHKNLPLSHTCLPHCFTIQGLQISLHIHITLRKMACIASFYYFP